MQTLVVGLDGVGDGFWSLQEAEGLVDHHGELETYYWTFPSFMCSLTGDKFDPNLQQSFKTHRGKHKMLWDYLDGLRQCYVNVPCIYPAEDINGCFICGWKAEKLDSMSVRPVSLLNELEDIGYQIGKEDNKLSQAADHGSWEVFLEEALNILDMRTKSIKYLADRFQPDILFFVYVVTDQCLHQRREERLGQERIDRLYHNLAVDIHGLLDHIRPDTVIFFSDHSVNMGGYHGPDHPSTKWGTWGLTSNLSFVAPRDKAHILDVFPTILSSLDVELPPVEGHSLLLSRSHTEAYKEKLRKLGYI